MQHLMGFWSLFVGVAGATFVHIFVPCKGAHTRAMESHGEPQHFSFAANLSHESLTIVGVSENNVPLNPMVNDHYPY